MTRRIRVVVTAEDIARGERMRARACPIARALHRSGYPTARVWGGVWDPGRTSDGIFAMSQAADRFLGRFDTAKPVRPAVFILEGPDL